MRELLNLKYTAAFLFTLLLIGLPLLWDHSMPIHWAMFSTAITVVFFFLFRFLRIRWEPLGVVEFQRKLFFFSLLLNSVALVFLYLLFYLFNESFFEPGAADSMIYHVHGVELAKRFSNFDFNIASYLRDSEFDDFGYNFFLGFIYWIFGPYTVVARLFNVLLAAMSVITLYKTARLVCNESIAKTSALLLALFPSYLMYVGMNLKEILMIFLVLQAIYYCTVIVLKGQSSLLTYVLVALYLVSLFFFRTVVGLSVLFSFMVFLTLNLSRSKTHKLVLFGGVIVSMGLVSYLLMEIKALDKVAAIFEIGADQMQVELNDKVAKGGGLSIKTAVISPLLFLAVFLAPFATLVLLDDQVLIAWGLSGALIKNILGLFAITGLISIVRKEWKKSSLIVGFTLSYLLILAVSAQTTSGRLQLVGLPFICVFIAIGLHNYYRNQRVHWMVYLVVIGAVILAWNFFKLSIRGLI